MELGATSSAIDANSNSLVAPVIQSRPSAMELLAAMELPSAMEPAAVHNANFGVGSGSHSYQHYILWSKLFWSLLMWLHACSGWSCWNHRRRRSWSPHWTSEHTTIFEYNSKFIYYFLNCLVHLPSIEWFSYQFIQFYTSVGLLYKWHKQHKYWKSVKISKFSPSAAYLEKSELFRWTRQTCSLRAPVNYMSPMASRVGISYKCFAPRSKMRYHRIILWRDGRQDVKGVYCMFFPLVFLFHSVQLLFCFILSFLMSTSILQGTILWWWR